MSDFWPDGLSLEKVKHPLEILAEAQQEWIDNSGGEMELLIQKAMSNSGLPLIVVHAKHVPSGRTASLINIIHREEEPYPIRLFPRNDDLPDILKHSYYKPGFADAGSAIKLMSQGSTINNEWVCDTPTEFREMLSKAFNTSGVKIAVISLLSAPPIEDEKSPSEVKSSKDAETDDA